MMTKKEKKRIRILSFMQTMPIVSTDQVAFFFDEHGSPTKRASEALKELEREKMIEGRVRELGKSKVWRLSKFGKDKLGIKKFPVPLTYRNIEHVLEIGDFYLSLVKAGLPVLFQYEPREAFIGNNGRKFLYCPDALFSINENYFLLEVQRTPLYKKGWSEKWNVAKAFFDEGHFNNSTLFSLTKGNTPNIVVMTNQKESIITVDSGSLRIVVVNDLKYFIDGFCIKE